MDYLKRYMDIIVHAVLGLQQDEGLSINTDPSHVEFALDLAQVASEITLQQVSVVVIDEGHPRDALHVVPVEHELSPHNPSGYVLLRLDDTEQRIPIGQPPDAIVRDFALLQQAGNLAPPQLDRPVAPWAVVAVPGPHLAQAVLGPYAVEQDLWSFLSPVLKLDRDDPVQAWKEQTVLINRRMSDLNRLDSQHLRITTASTDLTVALVQQSRWRNGVLRLASGRTFLPRLPLDRVTMLPDRQVTNGVLCASRSFPLLGGTVEGALFEFESGKVVRYDATHGKELLDLAFKFDEGARYLGEVSLVDQDVQLAQLSFATGYCGFDENAGSSILFGMGESSHLEALDMYEDAYHLQQETGCNASDIRFRVPFGDGSLRVDSLDSDEFVTTIMHNGLFIQ